MFSAHGRYSRGNCAAVDRRRKSFAHCGAPPLDLRLHYASVKDDKRHARKPASISLFIVQISLYLNVGTPRIKKRGLRHSYIYNIIYIPDMASSRPCHPAALFLLWDHHRDLYYPLWPRPFFAFFFIVDIITPIRFRRTCHTYICYTPSIVCFLYNVRKEFNAVQAQNVGYATGIFSYQ